jgi:hypothetical protein
VDYDVKRVLGYISLGLGLYFLKQQMINYPNIPWVLSSELILLYLLTTVFIERRRDVDHA